MFYKLIKDNSIVGAVTSDDFRKIQPKHNVIMYANIRDAQFAEYSFQYYRDSWFRPLPDNNINTVYDATFVEITEEEYNALIEAIENHEEIPVDEPEVIPTPPEIEEDEALTIEYIREAKISQMSNACHNIIQAGFDVVLSDNETHHFSLELEDQIKIQALAMKALRGDSLLAWHSDGELCKFYSASDIMIIYSELEKIQTYHTTYFNSLKNYINSLNTIEEIAVIEYGAEIPIEYQSEVLKYLLNN